MNNQKLMKQTKKWMWFAAFTIPALFLYSLFVIYPMIRGTIFLSFHSWNPLRRNLSYVGMENFINLFSDPEFYKSFLVTLKFMIIVVIGGNVIALLLAMAIESSRLKLLFRNIFFIPYVVSGLIVGYLFRFMFVGVFPDIMKALGLAQLAEISWYSNPNSALFASLVVPDIWKGIGFLILLYIAGLQAIPKDVLEAAVIDGASVVKQKVYVVLPMLMSTISVNLFLSVSGAFKQFELAFITGGGPASATKLLSYSIYQVAFSRRDYGMACAIALVLMIIIGIVTFTQLKLTGKKETEI